MNKTLSPADAPLWRTVNTPEGKGVVNLGSRDIRVYSDGDFPHWTGWTLVDDDSDTNSQCNSPTVLCSTQEDLSRMICHFPLEWDKATVDTRFEWLKSPNEALDEPMTECDWNLLTDHGKALCLVENPLPSGRVWHFEPRQFIGHFRKCGWLSITELTSLIPKFYYFGYPGTAVKNITTWADKFSDWQRYYNEFNRCCNKYNILSVERKSIFLGQIYIETNLVSTTTEMGKGKKNKKGEWPTPAMEYYQVFYGGGLMQLTWPENYENHGNLRSKNSLSDVNSNYTYIDNRITSLTRHYWADPRVTVIDKETAEKSVTINENIKNNGSLVMILKLFR